MTIRPGAASVVLATVLLSGSIGSAQSNCSERRLVTELGERVRTARQLGPDSRAFTITARTATVAYVRVRIERLDPGSCRDWLVVLRGDDFRILQTFTADDFEADTSRWTLRLPSRAIRLSLVGCGRDVPTFNVDEHLEVPRKSDSRFFSTKDRNVEDWTALYNAPPRFRELGDALGIFTSAWGDQLWVCSGLLLADRLFLTNWHCGGPNTYRAAGGTEQAFPDDWRWNDLVRRDALVDLSWDGDALSQDYSVASVLAKNRELDYAVLELAPQPSAIRLPRVRLAAGLVPSTSELVLLHHPLGEPKQVSFVGCVADDVRRPGWKAAAITEFTHTCDTEGGSSGGPVFTTSGEVVGLHHLGFHFASDCSSSDERNKAIHIGCVMKDLPDALRTRIAPGATFTCPPVP
jgi:hypothetical protein